MTETLHPRCVCVCIGAYGSRERKKSVPWQGSTVTNKQGSSRTRKLSAHNFNASTKLSEQEVA